jgi:hypothetical protein
VRGIGSNRSSRPCLVDRGKEDVTVALAHNLIEAAPLLAVRGGTLVVVGVVFGIVLALYAVYWMIFKVGKD